MNAASEISETAAASPDDSSVPLAARATNVVSAWASLLCLEAVLAQRSLRLLLFGAIALPVVGLSAWLGLSAILVALAHMYTHGWLLALLFGFGLQLLAFALLLNQLRCWARDLTLPRSRAALVHAMERMA